MSIPKRHHYLPEFYLRGFCSGETLWLFDRERNQMRQQTPANTAVRSYYYAFDEPAGSRNTQIEALLSRVESDAKPCLEALRHGKALKKEERAKLAFFFALLRTRVPEFHGFVEEIHEKMMKSTLRMIGRREGALDRLMAQVPTKDVSVEQLREFIERGEYRVKLGREASLVPMLQLSVGLARAFEASNWAVLAPRSAGSFITSDDPVVPVWPKREGFYPTPFLSPEVGKVIPIAHDTLLMIAGEGSHQVNRAVGKSEIRQLNVFIATASTSFVIARDQALLKNMVSKARLHTPPVRERVHVSGT